VFPNHILVKRIQRIQVLLPNLRNHWTLGHLGHFTFIYSSFCWLNEVGPCCVFPMVWRLVGHFKSGTWYKDGEFNTSYVVSRFCIVHGPLGCSGWSHGQLRKNMLQLMNNIEQSLYWRVPVPQMENLHSKFPMCFMNMSVVLFTNMFRILKLRC
jgi:hypothetical protein